MTEIETTLDNVKITFERLKTVLRSCEAENAVLRELLSEAVGGLCDGCSGKDSDTRRCESCKWASIRNGEIQ